MSCNHKRESICEFLVNRIIFADFSAVLSNLTNGVLQDAGFVMQDVAAALNSIVSLITTKPMINLLC